jgi:hypothetical protein
MVPTNLSGPRTNIDMSSHLIGQDAFELGQQLAIYLTRGTTVYLHTQRFNDINDSMHMIWESYPLPPNPDWRVFAGRNYILLENRPENI